MFNLIFINIYFNKAVGGKLEPAVNPRVDDSFHFAECFDYPVVQIGVVSVDPLKGQEGQNGQKKLHSEIKKYI